MYFTRNTVFDLDLGIKATLNIAQYPKQHVTYAHARFEVAMSNFRFRSRYIYKKTQYLTFDLNHGVKVTPAFVQFPLHHVTYVPAKCEVAMSNS